MKPKPYIVGICGGSASGKTFLLKQLLSQLPQERVNLISQDNYYKQYEQQKKDEEGLVNFDHPESVDLDAFVRDVKTLIGGKPVSIQEYTFNNPASTARTLHYHPTDLLVLEGLFIFYHPELYKLIDLKIFVDADEHIRLTRRLRRDHSERGYSFDSILRDYSRFVAPMYEQYVAPAKKVCDLIIPNNKHMYKAIQVLVNHLKMILEEK
ncbi:MAG: uridine kinase [Bacteroidetes bacterium]|nr:MAG: uridine kinase [Bacteroidota bacterium]